MTQTLAELTSVDDPAGPLLREWLEAGQVDAQILSVEPERRDQCLVGMQVTLRSVLGALAYETGGLLIDHGWLRSSAAVTGPCRPCTRRWACTRAPQPLSTSCSGGTSSEGSSLSTEARSAG